MISAGAPMTEFDESLLKKREYELKLVQAWVDGRNKLANAALIANGAGLAIVITFVKDKGIDHVALAALRACTFGAALAFLAFLMTTLIAETVFNEAISEADGGSSNALGWISRPIPLFVYNLLVLLSFASLAYGIGYFTGSSEVLLETKSAG
jgi:hypothetical protein